MTFDITIGEESIGKVKIALFGKTVPKTAENFKQLCVRHLTEVRLRVSLSLFETKLVSVSPRKPKMANWLASKAASFIG